MSFTAKTAFQPRMWNNRNNDLQNVAGKFGAVSGSDFVGADCDAGAICIKGEALPYGGYQMTVAADGKGGEVYFCNPGDVQRGVIGNGLYAAGIDTLGLGANAGDLVTFTKAIPGETYAFGDGNFSTVMSTTNKYATIANGKLVGTSTAPTAGTGIYFELDASLGIDQFTEGNTVPFNRYNVLCKTI
jgi:hypothetical protein